MKGHVIELLGRTSNKKQIDNLISSLLKNPIVHILKLEYNKEFKNWCIWGYYDKLETPNEEETNHN